MTLISFRSRSTLGVYEPHIYRPPKTAFNNSEPIALKFDIEIVCTQEIIMGYMSLEIFFKGFLIFLKKGSQGTHPPIFTLPTNFFFLKIVRGTLRIFSWLNLKSM